MLGVLYLLLFLAGGLFVSRCLLPRHSVLARIWIGASLGLLLLMWLPVLCAFAMRFSLAAHWTALGLLALLCALAWTLRSRDTAKAWDERESHLFRQMLVVCVPLILLSAILQYTHVCRVDADGSWHVGQSTYGDLSMHMAFITGLRNAQFPSEYPIFPGTRLSYPFLTDSLSTTFYLFGWEIQPAIIVPSVLMMGLLYMGVMILARDMTRGGRAVVMATLLFFLNGGLGFLYNLDQAAGYEADGSLTIVSRLREIMEGYYMTPTNQPDPNNLRWSNLIADLLVPQRTLMGGYCMVVPCLYLLYGAYDPSLRDRRGGIRERALLGIWGGALPMIHTHSFLALALCSMGYMVYDLLHGAEKRKIFLSYAFYGVIAAALSIPQLVLFTFSQVHELDGNASRSFLQFQFNWVNNPGGNGMRDFYLFFYVKNIGLPVLFLLGAVFERNPKWRRILAAMLPMVLAAELVRFQPNEYDNNKIFYLAYLLACMVIAEYMGMLWRRMKGVRARNVMALFLCVCLFLAPVLTLARELVSDYQAYSALSVESGMYVREHTEEDSVFLTGREHLNPVSAIAGRRIVCGPDLYLYWHGIDTAERDWDIMRFYTDPAGNADVLEKYGVDYIYVSSYERSSYDIDGEALETHYEKIFDNLEAQVYRVK